MGERKDYETSDQKEFPNGSITDITSIKSFDFLYQNGNVI